MAQRRLILIRHGETEYNATKRMQGQLDTTLSPVGIAQAKAAAADMAEWNVAALYTSDLQRATHTAELLNTHWNLPIHTDSRLRETHLGAWTGKTHEDVDSSYPAQRLYWRHDATWSPPGGENRRQVAERAFELVQELMHTDIFDHGMVVMVAHGGTIGALTARLLGLPSGHFTMFSGLGNVRWSQLVARPRFTSSTAPLSAPASDGSQVPDLTHVPAQWWVNPDWHLEGWNMSTAAPLRPSDWAASPDEGGEDEEQPEGSAHSQYAQENAADSTATRDAQENTRGHGGVAPDDADLQAGQEEKEGRV